MNVPMCIWNPQDRESLQIQRWPRSTQWSYRAESPTSRGRDADDLVDSLRMNLRQAKDAITVRDQETRRLRAAVTHLEGTLSLRERELRDTIFCLSGASPARPHQEWLQEGTSSSRLRLQVHRLQRAVATKQDHIDHLNRQASLGFLREAREEADEYRVEVKRLTRALAAATGGIGGPGRFSARFTTTAKRFSPMNTEAGDTTAAVVDRTEAGDHGSQVPTRVATYVEGGRYPREAPSQSQLAGPSAERGGGRGIVEAPQHSADENNTWSLATRKGAEGDRRMQPQLAWEATVGAAIRESSGACGEVRQGDVPRSTRFDFPTANVGDDLGAGLAVFSRPAAAVHGGSPRRRRGASSARVVCRGSPRGSRSPDRWSANSEKKRLSCMAASARFRASMRQSAAERNELLTLTEEARRLQAARAERARRARLTQRKIARYREARIHELEARLARRCGKKPQGAAGDAAETVSPDKESPDDGTGARSGGGGGGQRDCREEGSGTPVDVGTNNNDSTLQKLSRQRKEIDAAIAAAMEASYSQEESPTGGERHNHPERPSSTGRRRTTGKQEKAPHGRQRRQRQRQSSGAENIPHEEDRLTPGGQQLENPTRPIGKPPRAPLWSGDRSRQASGAGRSSRARVVDHTASGSDGGGSIAESFAWEGGDFNDVDEVQTEEGGGNDDSVNSNWRDSHLSGGEGSVWEEPFSFGEWEGDQDRNSPTEGDPPLVELGEVHVHGPENRDDPRRRQRHRLTGTHGNRQAGAEHWQEEPVPAQAAPHEGSGKEVDGRGVREQRDVVAGELDDEGSCNSRWSLSAEDEAQERNDPVNGSHAQRAYSGDETRGEDGFKGRPISAEGRGRETSPEVNSEAAGHGTDDVAKGVPEYLEDFFDGSEQEFQGNRAPFAVSSPSDEENEGFAAAQELPTTRNGPDQDRFLTDANNESNEWLINGPPGRPSRPLPVAGGSYEPGQPLLQPVLPIALRYDSEGAAGGGCLAETADAGHYSSTAEPAMNKIDDVGSGENELGRKNPEGQQPADMLGHDTQSSGQTKGGSKPEKEATCGDDVITPLRIDSTVLFASLSSSTAAAASISSKSMARVEGNDSNPTRELAGARQGEGSSSTFALSADEECAAVVPASDHGNDFNPNRELARARQREGSSTFALSADEDDTTVAPASDHGNKEKDVLSSVDDENAAGIYSTSGRQLELRIPPSDQGDGAVPAETSRRSATSPSSGGTGNLDGAPDEGVASRPTSSPHATTTSPQAERRRPSSDSPPAASLEEEGRPSQKREHQLAENDGTSALSTGSKSPGSVKPSGYLRSNPSFLGETAQEPATSLEGDDTKHSAEADYSPRSGEKGDKGGVALRSEEEATLGGRGRSIVSSNARDTSLCEDDRPTGDSAAAVEKEGSTVGALEERSSVSRGSSQSGSVLDVGGGGVDDLGDDDGYF